MRAASHHTPRFSLKPGSYAAGTTLSLKDRTRGAAIYYTTDGWTPTTHSTRYIGPIVLSQPSVFQAIAVAPSAQPSRIASAVYTLSGTGAMSAQVADTSHDTILLTFTEPVTSVGKQIGDRLPIVLAKDLHIGGRFAAPQGTTVLATITGVDGPGHGGAPGSITFAVHSVSFHERTISLAGEETKQGQPRTRTAESLMAIPFVGISGAFVRGKDVTIPAGATLTARVQGGA